MLSFSYEKLADTKGLIRIRISKKSRRQHNGQKKKSRQHNGQKKKSRRQHNGQKRKYKRTNNDLQNITPKTRNRAPHTSLRPEVKPGAPEG